MKNILKNKRTQIFLALLVVFTLHTQVFTHLVFARGGGELAKFSNEKFAVSVGIGLASVCIGNVISSGVGELSKGGEFLAGAGEAIGNYGNIGRWASSFNSMAALNQLGSGIKMIGQQQEWDVSRTVFVSSVITGAVGGGLNLRGGLGSSVLSGAIAGTTEGAILANNVDEDGTINPWVNAAAGMAGAFTGGITSAYTAEVVPTDIPGQRSHMANNFGEAFTHGAVRAFSTIPSELITVGVSRITKDMDKQDAFRVKQAFSGAYPIVGSVYKHTIRDPILERLDLERYTGHNGTGGSEWRKRDR